VNDGQEMPRHLTSADPLNRVRDDWRKRISSFSAATPAMQTRRDSNGETDVMYNGSSSRAATRPASPSSLLILPALLAKPRKIALACSTRENAPL